MAKEKLTAGQRLAIENAIRFYFQPLYKRLSTVEQLILERRHRHELILLLGAYLDALANTVLGHKFSSSELRMGSFLETFSSFGSQWAQVSLPDLHQFIYSSWLWSNFYFSWAKITPKKKRPWLSPDEHTLVKSLETLGFSLVLDERDEIEGVLRDVSRRLAGLGRVTAEQDTGPSFLNEAKICFAFGPKLGEAFTPVIERFRVSSILYRNFRCSSVHELHLPTWLAEDEGFWTEEEPYFIVRKEPLALDIDTLALAFPARFMLKILSECIEKVGGKLITTLMFPVQIYCDLFIGTELDGLPVDVDVETSLLKDLKDLVL